ncbi:MAG: patatin-like phospholipase family protein [Bacteriovoracaceae bacterium]|nr:patatin-like phospholipase family protein [Bacteriovoracaceae bacterium]
MKFLILSPMHSELLNSFKNKKIALVLSGGVVKASAWHLGVVKALYDIGFNLKKEGETQNLVISTLVGSSAGSLIHMFLACGHHPQDIMDAHQGKKNSFKSIGYRDLLFIKKNPKGPKNEKRYQYFEGLPFGIKELAKPIANISGFFSTAGLAEYLKENVLEKNNFKDYPLDIFIVASYLDLPRKAIFCKKEIISRNPENIYRMDASLSDAVAASMSVPPLYSPYAIENKQNSEWEYFLDGEIRDTLSSHIAEENNCDLIINSWTYTPYEWNSEIGSLVNYGIPVIGLQSICLLIHKKITQDRYNKKKQLDALDAVSHYLKQERLDSHSKKILEILEEKLEFKKNIKHIDICPVAGDHDIFLNNSFSLNPELALMAFNRGYARTFEVFKYAQPEEAL